MCSSFCAALLRKSYRLSDRDLIRIFSEEWPEADEFFEAATPRREFTLVEKITYLQAGDFLVFDYQSEKAIPTGHVMLVSGKAIKRTDDAIRKIDEILKNTHVPNRIPILKSRNLSKAEMAEARKEYITDQITYWFEHTLQQDLSNQVFISYMVQLEGIKQE